jgi:hypothetical protein
MAQRSEAAMGDQTRRWGAISRRGSTRPVAAPL